jgi:hypothetical protein
MLGGAACSGGSDQGASVTVTVPVGTTTTTAVGITTTAMSTTSIVSTTVAATTRAAPTTLAPAATVVATTVPVTTTATTPATTAVPDTVPVTAAPTVPTPTTAPQTTVPPATTAACRVVGLNDIVRLGDCGDTVRFIQERLTVLGFPTSADGLFGSGTETAVKNFQSSRGLVADGIVGPLTWDKLVEGGIGD